MHKGSRVDHGDSPGGLAPQVDWQSDKANKRESFLRLAEKRTNAVIERIRILSNCSNPYAYEYTDEDVRQIFAAIDEELKVAKSKFTGRRRNREFRLKAN